MSDDIRDDPEFQRWEEEVQISLVPKIDGSVATISLVPTGKTDVKFALELGLSIMLDKPILAVVAPGAEVPERLRRVIDAVVEADIETPEGREVLQTGIQKFLSEHFPDRSQED